MSRSIPAPPSSICTLSATAGKAVITAAKTGPLSVRNSHVYFWHRHRNEIGICQPSDAVLGNDAGDTLVLEMPTYPIMPKAQNYTIWFWYTATNDNDVYIDDPGGSFNIVTLRATGAAMSRLSFAIVIVHSALHCKLEIGYDAFNADCYVHGIYIYREPDANGEAGYTSENVCTPDSSDYSTFFPVSPRMFDELATMGRDAYRISAVSNTLFHGGVHCVHDLSDRPVGNDDPCWTYIYYTPVMTLIRQALTIKIRVESGTDLICWTDAGEVTCFRGVTTTHTIMSQTTPDVVTFFKLRAAGPGVTTEVTVWYDTDIAMPASRVLVALFDGIDDGAGNFIVDGNGAKVEG